MNVRHLRDQEDAREVLRVHANAWRAAYSDLLSEDIMQDVVGEPSDERAQTAFDHLQDHTDRFLVAEDDEDTIQGYAYFRWGGDETKPFVGGDEAYLKEIYVDPAHWGEGIGTALLEYGLDLLPQTTTALKLEILSGNEVGEQFYEARGFEKTGTAEADIAGSTFQTIIYTLRL